MGDANCAAPKAEGPMRTATIISLGVSALLGMGALVVSRNMGPTRPPAATARDTKTVYEFTLSALIKSPSAVDSAAAKKTTSLIAAPVAAASTTSH